MDANITIQELYNKYLSHPVIITDSRKVLRDSIFFALKGDNFDGNTFAQKAIEMGAAYTVVDDPNVVKGERYILVENVLSTLQELAKYHRKQLNIPVIGITGSNGKTTTKELCRDVLSKKYKVKATVGNLNNHIGVPLTILSTPLDTELLIVEMGANHVGEIHDLCQISMPNYGMITNIGKAHLEGFGGVEGIKRGKSELYKSIAATGGQIFINVDDTVLTSLMPNDAKEIVYSASIIAPADKEASYISFTYHRQVVKTKLFGTYNYPNIAFAVAAGEYFGVTKDAIIGALEAYEPDNNRSQQTISGSNTIIKDAYNANPTSMKLSIESFARLQADSKVIVLGDMLELGEYAGEEHEQIIRLTESLGLKEKYFIGPNFFRLKNKFEGYFFETTEQAKLMFQQKKYSNATILLKGSRGIAVETIVK